MDGFAVYMIEGRPFAQDVFDWLYLIGVLLSFSASVIFSSLGSFLTLFSLIQMEYSKLTYLLIY